MKEMIYRLKRYPRALKEILVGKTNAIHVRCGEMISYRKVTGGYYAQCPECDEDLFSFEVVK